MTTEEALKLRPGEVVELDGGTAAVCRVVERVYVAICSHEEYRAAQAEGREPRCYGGVPAEDVLGVAEEHHEEG